MDRLLVLSNNSASLSESNGRIHSYYVQEYINSGSLHNFYVRGNPDIDNVNYLTISNKKALLSKLSFGLIKPTLVVPSNSDNSGSPSKASPKSKYPIFHLLRSFAFFRNIGINKLLSKYIKDNNIDEIMLWGTNIPFLYRYSYLLCKINNIKLSIFTGEDYPLKDYNYLNKGKFSLLFKCFQHSLRKEAYKAYKYSSMNIYATEDLKELYESKMGISGGVVKMFMSNVKPINKPRPDKIRRILYGGNLYISRAKSLCDVAEYILKYPEVYIDVYGEASNDVLDLFGKYSNIHYKGQVPYNELLHQIENADMLLHVEGFDPYYVKDCRYAFSTKISDYIQFGIPFFVYGPIGISGVKYCYNRDSNMVAVNKEELNKIGKLYE